MSLKVVDPNELGLVCMASGSCRELDEVKEGLALGSVQWGDQGVDAGDGLPGRLPQICFLPAWRARATSLTSASVASCMK